MEIVKDRMNKLLKINIIVWYLFVLSIALLNSVSVRSVIISIGLSIIHLGLGYVNFNYYIPKLLFKKKTIKYFLTIFFTFLLCLGLIAILFKITRFHEDMPRDDDNHEITDVRSFFRFLLTNPMSMLMIVVIVISTTLKFFQLYKTKELEAQDKENQRLTSELKFLKSQINPHFLFNSLNNIYSMVVRHMKSAPEQIEKLSNILRFLLYDTEESEIELKHEVKYIDDYIDLQIVKDKSLASRVVKSYKINANPKIEPMLLIPFIENAFKHSDIESNELAFIEIKLSVDNKFLHFKVENSFSSSRKKNKTKIGGIGIKNVEDRLKILYPNNYKLNIEFKENVYSVDFTINLF
jgi:sensor histidine kinase YesM